MMCCASLTLLLCQSHEIVPGWYMWRRSRLNSGLPEDAFDKGSFTVGS